MSLLVLTLKVASCGCVAITALLLWGPCLGPHLSTKVMDALMWVGPPLLAALSVAAAVASWTGSRRVSWWFWLCPAIAVGLIALARVGGYIRIQSISESLSPDGRWKAVYYTFEPPAVWLPYTSDPGNVSILRPGEHPSGWGNVTVYGFPNVEIDWVDAGHLVVWVPDLQAPNFFLKKSAHEDVRIEYRQ